jgi:hypothetical protein
MWTILLLLCFLMARRLKLPTELGKLDFKAAFKLDQSYSLQGKVLPLLQQHDELCDLLSQLALEIQQAVAVERDIDPRVRPLFLDMVCAERHGGCMDYTWVHACL